MKKTLKELAAELITPPSNGPSLPVGQDDPLGEESGTAWSPYVAPVARELYALREENERLLVRIENLYQGQIALEERIAALEVRPAGGGLTSDDVVKLVQASVVVISRTLSETLPQR